MEEQETAPPSSSPSTGNSDTVATENTSENQEFVLDSKGSQLQNDTHDVNNIANDTSSETNSNEVLNDLSNDVGKDAVNEVNAEECVKSKSELENNVDSIETLINNIDHQDYNVEADNDNAIVKETSNEIEDKVESNDSELTNSANNDTESIVDNVDRDTETTVENEKIDSVTESADQNIEEPVEKVNHENEEENVDNAHEENGHSESDPKISENTVEDVEMQNDLVENETDDALKTNEESNLENEQIKEDNDEKESEIIPPPDSNENNDNIEKTEDKNLEAMETENSTDTPAEPKENGPNETQESDKMDVDLDNTSNDIAEKGEPTFESAPENTTMDISHTSDSKPLDPFDQLLSGTTTPNKTSSTVQVRKEFNYNNDDDDDDMDNTGLDFDNNDSTTAETGDDTITEEGPVADITEGQGADEEVCLLPDTEREISEADKLKALAAKKSETCGFDSLIEDSSLKLGDDLLQSSEMKREVISDGNEKSQDEVVGDENDLGELQEDVEAAEDESAKDLNDADKDREEEIISEEPLLESVIQEINAISGTCIQCSQEKTCKYRLLVDGEVKQLCETECVIAYQELVPDKYTLSYKKVYIREVKATPKENNSCIQCSNDKKCYYEVLSDDANKLLCGEVCLNAFIGADKEKYFINRKKKIVHEITEKETLCHVCSETKNCVLEVSLEGELKYICGEACMQTLEELQPNIFKIRKKRVIRVKQAPRLKVISNATDKGVDVGSKIIAKTPEQVEEARADRDRSFFRKCAHCSQPYLGNDKNLSWETMDFCNETCLGDYQNTHGSHCANCKSKVSMTSLGKYCVRFGYEIRQFCRSGCLEEFKKGLKICCYCQRDISSGMEGFLAPVGDKGQFKDFCSQFCVEKFDQMSRSPVPPPIWTHCAVCSKEKMTQLEVGIDDKISLRLCSEPCFAAFKFVNHIFPDQCRWCNKYFERKSIESYTIYADTATHCFCSKACMNVYISNSRHIVPCNWCKVKKYNFDMISRTLANGQNMTLCSLNCLTLYQVSLNAVSSKRIKCDQCKHYSPAQYHLTMSDATVRNFCKYQCVMSFQSQYSKTPLVVEGESFTRQEAVPTGAPRKYMGQKNNAKGQSAKTQASGLPVIASVQSLAPTTPASVTRGKRKASYQDKRPGSPESTEISKPASPPPPAPPKIYNHVIVRPAPPKEVRNMCTMTKPITLSKSTSCRVNTAEIGCQTEDFLEKRILIPVPVPVYVPTPLAMYSIPVPIPVPIPLPLPVPVFIPTTRNSANGIMKEIKKIHEKMPTDPLEAELLMMAEMVAGDKKKCDSDSESDEDNDDGFSPDAMDTGNSGFSGEDMLQMALKMATEYEEPAVDLESAMTASTITPSSHPTMPNSGLDESGMQHHHLMLIEQQRATALAMVNNRKRGGRTAGPTTPTARSAKRSRRAPDPTPPPMPEPPREPAEKPDANMCLKYTFGVNAWKQWVVTKNAEMEKSSLRRKPFKSEILQLTADELNYSLCLFVKEVRKPNGSEYAPDTIYYLVLGIQQYLFENGRIDNIFTDPYYEKFTECLDEVARKFSVLYNDSQYIVTRVEEEHLWESKQLGAHSPHVLLSTLMFFNTKHFNLVTVEEHMQLSFSHIMKHWKRNPNQPGATKIAGSRNVLLRFYPPQSALEANTRKKKVYEQQENEENPLRCPVKLYEFYLSKCPESVKTRNDVFYLMPERSCVPDSPVWYSTQPLGREPLSKMLHRVKMVKEINIALLTS